MALKFVLKISTISRQSLMRVIMLTFNLFLCCECFVIIWYVCVTTVRLSLILCIININNPYYLLINNFTLNRDQYVGLFYSLKYTRYKIFFPALTHS